MKKIFLTIAAITSIFTVMAQSNFTIERSDTLSTTKEQIYDDTKRFISEFWNSEDVIKQDDKETGIILVKGLIYITKYHRYEHKYIYSYHMKFLMKEKKYKIIIDNIECITAICEINVNCPYVDFCESCDFPGYSATFLNENTWKQLMRSLKSEFTAVADKYEKYIKTASPSGTNW
jgi:hypothetical protein